MRSTDEESEKSLVTSSPPLNDVCPTAETKSNSTAAMLRLSLWVSFAAWIANFDNGYTGTILIMPSYRKAFGTCREILNPTTGQISEHCSITPLQQSLISLNYMFIGLGGGLSALTGRYTGRRGAIQIGCGLAIIGAAGMLGTGNGSPKTFYTTWCANASVPLALDNSSLHP